MTAQPPVDDAARKALEGLADIVVPAPVSWLPQTWGWAALAAVLIAMLVAWAWNWRRHALANRYRVEALRVLTSIERRLADPADRDAALDDIAIVIKRTAIAAYSRTEVARLSGQEWTTFLRGHGLDNRTVRALLDDAEYRADASRPAISDADARTLIAAARAWIKGHRVPA